MLNMNFERVEKVFKDYIDTFDWDNENIRRKYFHTIEVANNCYEIANLMGLTDDDKDLAKLIGYLHDIGRFIQITKKNTFNDRKLDHAAEGVKILFEEGMIRKFIDDDKYDETIKKAVYNHNKFEIVDSLDDRELLFANIIRDADKIDILRINANESKYSFEYTPSKKTLESFEKRELVKLIDIKNESDSALCVLAFIFDFNYKESLQILKEKGYYLDFINSLKVSNENVEMFNKIKKQALRELEV